MCGSVSEGVWQCELKKCSGGEDDHKCMAMRL